MRERSVELNYSLIKKHKFSKIEKYDDIKVNPENFINYYNKISNIYENIPYTFRKKIRYLREYSGLTREELEELSNVSAQTIKLIETDEKRGYSIETIISLCIGMKLPPDLSFDLISIAGFNINNSSNKKNAIYSFILRYMYYCEINYINDILEKNNFKSLN